jgi:hypothetical protein
MSDCGSPETTIVRMKEIAVNAIKSGNHPSNNEDEWQYSDKDKLFKFFDDEHDFILTDGQLDDIIHAVNQSKEFENQTDIWKEIEKEAFKLSDNPSFDYGVPYWAISDFIDNLSNKYSICLK